MTHWLGATLLTWALATPEFDWLKQVLERPYEGVGVQQTEAFSGGKLVTSHTLQLSSNETLQLTGTFGTTLIIDNVPYRATHKVSAEYLSSQQALVLRGTLASSDTLPRGMKFCDFTGKLQMGNDASRPGHFAMQGDLVESCGGSTVQLTLGDKAPDT